MKKTFTTIIIICALIFTGCGGGRPVVTPTPAPTSTPVQTSKPTTTPIVTNTPVVTPTETILPTPDATPEEIIFPTPTQIVDDGIDYEEAYSIVIQTYVDYHKSGRKFDGITADERGNYLRKTSGVNVPYYSCTGSDFSGYCFIDINNDGIKEMIVSSENQTYEPCICDFFTLIDGKPERIVSSSDRIVYHLRDDHLILCISSTGYYAWHRLMSFSGHDMNLIKCLVRAGDEYYEDFADIEGFMDMMLTEKEANAYYHELTYNLIVPELTPFIPETEATP